MNAHTLVFENGAAGQPTQLVGSRCPQCCRVQFPAHRCCPACAALSAELRLTGPARLVFATDVLAQPPDSLVQAPYGVGVAEFPEAIRVIGLLDNPAPAVGDAVIPVVYRPTDELVTFAFRKHQ
jgi:uncharacterized OB-fold protein